MPPNGPDEWRARIGHWENRKLRWYQAHCGSRPRVPLHLHLERVISEAPLLCVLLLLSLAGNAVTGVCVAGNGALSSLGKVARSYACGRRGKECATPLLSLFLALSLLLVIAGDVETNPGPISDELLAHVDDSELAEKDTRDVYREVISVAGRWSGMCLALGLLPSDHSAIEAAHCGNPHHCLQAVVVKWLQKGYDYQRLGPPTWRMLVESVGDPAGGNNTALAEAIAKRHPDMRKTNTSSHPADELLAQVDDTELTDDNLFEVYKEVLTLAYRWSDLCFALHLPISHETIRKENQAEDCNRCLRMVLKKWLQKSYNYQRYGPPTWRMLVKAVGDPFGGNDTALAEAIAKKHTVMERAQTISAKFFIDDEEWDPPTEFADMLVTVAKLLDKSADVEQLKQYLEFLCHPRTGQRYINIRLYEHCITPGEIIKALHPQYINFVHTHLLRRIVNKFGDEQSKILLKQYEDNFPCKKPLKRMRDPLLDEEIESETSPKHVMIETQFISDEELDPPTEFAEMLTQVAKLLDISADVKDLKNFLGYLCHPRTGTRWIDTKLYEHCNTPQEIIMALYPQYINFMHTHLLKQIVNKFGDEQSKTLLKQYEDMFPRKKPLKHMGDPHSGKEIESFTGTKRMKVVYSDATVDTTTMEDVERVQQSITRSTGVDESMIVYTKQIPATSGTETLLKQYEDRFPCKKPLKHMGYSLSGEEIESFTGTKRMKFVYSGATVDTTMKDVERVRQSITRNTGVDESMIVYADQTPATSGTNPKDDELLAQVDDTELTDDNLFEVYKEVFTLAHRWSDLCFALHLPILLEETICKENQVNGCNHCLRMVLRKWLQKSYNYQRYGLPTWRMLVTAVGDPAGGNDIALAEAIAKKHTVMERAQTISAKFVSDDEEWDPPTEFADMLVTVAKLLDKSADVEQLKQYLEFLCHPRTGQRYINIRLYEHCITPGEIIKALHPQYINFVHTHLLRRIVNKFGDEQSKILLKQYEDNFPCKKPLKRMRDPLLDEEIESETSPKHVMIETQFISDEEYDPPTEFAEMLTQVAKLLNRSADVKDLKDFLDFLCHPHTGTRLIDTKLYMHCITPGEIIKALHPRHINFMHTHVLRRIVIKFGDEQSKTLLKQYEDRFPHKRPLKRMCDPLSDEEINAFTGTKRIKIEIGGDANIDTTTVEDVERVQQTISRYTGIDESMIVYANQTPATSGTNPKDVLNQLAPSHGPTVEYLTYDKPLKQMRDPVPDEETEAYTESKRVCHGDADVDITTVEGVKKFSRSTGIGESMIVYTDQTPATSGTNPKDGFNCLLGVAVVGEVELVVTNEATNFHWQDHGFKLNVPENALPEGVSEYSVNIKASLTGQFKLPEGYELVSPVYWIRTPGKFTKPVTIQAQHCANFSSSSQLCFVRTSCAQKFLPYKFKFIDGGSFVLDNKYGALSTTHFSGIGIATPAENSSQYCAQVYYTVIHKPDYWYCHFVVTKDLEICLKLVKSISKYKQENDIALHITFGAECVADYVALDIPDDGIHTDNGWEIVPLQKAHIKKDQVNNFSLENSWIPECVLLLKWKQKSKVPEPLEYKVKMLGTGEDNFFRIFRHPESQPIILASNLQKNGPDAVEGLAHGTQDELTIGDLDEVTNYLLDLGNTDIHNLGITLGLFHPHLKNMETSETFRDDMIAAWLQKEDQVTKKGVPTWKTLVKALRDRRVNQTGVADKIETEKCVTE